MAPASGARSTRILWPSGSGKIHVAGRIHRHAQGAAPAQNPPLIADDFRDAARRDVKISPMRRARSGCSRPPCPLRLRPRGSPSWATV